MSYDRVAAAYGRKISEPDWEKKLFGSTRLTEGQKEDLHKVIVWDFYLKNGGTATFAKFWDMENDPTTLRAFGERYSLVKWELVTLGFYSTVDVPYPSFRPSA